MSRITIQASWDDCPHLTEEAKTEMLAAIPEWQRDSRSKGYPDLGAGAIYPISQEEYITDRKPEESWPRAYGLDVGWNSTAAVFLAYDTEARVAYAYDSYERGHAEPAIHAAGIRSKGAWIPGACDPAAIASSQVDGSKLMEIYGELGLILTPADNAVIAGVTLVWNLLSTGQLKICRHLLQLLKQMKMYRRDEKGRILKKDDHLCDALRYACASGPDIMRTRPAALSLDSWLRPSTPGGGWMG